MTATMDTEQWPNKGEEVIRVAITMSVLSMVSTIWRLIARSRASLFMGCSDWLMLAGSAMNFVCNIPFGILCVRAGAGRLVSDPFWASHRVYTTIHFEFISINLQMNAMFLVKLSVCTYLLALNFSRRFRVIMWLVTLIVVMFNLIMPLLFNFWSCQPYYFRWHPEIVPECWPEMVGMVAIYAQIVSNICTDLVYASAPLVYLRQVKLTKQMRCKVRIMFLLALIGTSSSVVKMYVMHQWLHSSEPFYDIADLSIWGINEVSICIVVANLPMQSRSISRAIAFIVPNCLHPRLGLESDEGYVEDDSFTSTIDNLRQTRSITPGADDGSEMAIIELENGRIVMAPRTPTPAVVRDNGSQGMLATFWRNDSKESMT
ncbi:hypothetical protein DPSP01_004765 [Paraphaeosphaeria sporulosa]